MTQSSFLSLFPSLVLGRPLTYLPTKLPSVRRLRPSRGGKNSTGRNILQWHLKVFCNFLFSSSFPWEGHKFEFFRFVFHKFMLYDTYYIENRCKKLITLKIKRTWKSALAISHIFLLSLTSHLYPLYFSQNLSAAFEVVKFTNAYPRFAKRRSYACFL